MRQLFYKHKNVLSLKTLILVFVLLFLILSASAIFDYFSRRKTAIANMTHFSQMLINTITKSTASSIISNNLLKIYIDRWITSELQGLDNIESSHPLDNKFLQEYADDKILFHLSIYSPTGQRVYFSHASRKCAGIDSLIQPILDKKTDHLILGIHPFEGMDEEGYFVAVARKKGGAIIGSIRGSQFLILQNIGGIERYLNSLTTDSSVLYIAIQDSNGITASTKEIGPISDFQTDIILRQLQTQGQFHWRNITYNNKLIYEAIVPLIVINKYRGILRIGLDYSPVLNLQKVILRQSLIRIMILLIIGFILFSYSISIQNIQLLENEKEKITNEVYSLQHDLRQKEKMSAVGELAAGIAHEIRNPLGAISMTVQRLSREFKPEKDADELKCLLNIIRKEIDHISNSIKNLLQFSKPAPLQRSQNRIDKIITKIISLYQNKAEETGITLKRSDQTEAQAFVDAVKIEDCLVNLLENALAATPSGGSIEFGLRKRQNTIIITLKDTGVGIPEKNLSKIFNLYYTTKANGTGLGLAHAQQIISEHGGTIRVDSRENKGTTFTIALPGN